MKFILSFFFCVLLYTGCANNSSTNILDSKTPISVKKNIAKNKKTEGSWDNPKNRGQLLEALKESKSEGLLPEDYDYSKIAKLEANYTGLNPKEIIEYYDLLSKNFRKYINHLTNGKLKPKILYTDWEIKTKKVNSDSLLKVALNEGSIPKTLEAYKPKHAIYKYLKKALAIIDSYPEDNAKPIITKEKFTVKGNSKTLVAIKKRLQYWHDLPKEDTLSTLYDEALENAVKKFQARHGLEADGVIGQGTIAALNKTKAQRKEQIIVNLERWRWFPSDLGINYVAVNIPNYMLHTVQNTDTTKVFKVVVGSEKRKTPILSSKIDNIVFNPTWTVPPTILKEDLIPGTIKSRKYITNRNIKIYNRKGKEVSIGDWLLTSAEDYKYVQSPGENNSLGYVKINFPNNHSVYLHDTNHRDLFVKNYRALSSGCVRVENPLKLAEYLLYNKENYTTEKIDSILFLKKTKTVTMDEEIDVHILYFTAWYDSGELQFRNDVYAYDKDVYLRLTNQVRSDLIISSGVINK